MGKRKAPIPITNPPTCVDIPPYPTGAGPGCLLYGDGEHMHWSDPPEDGSQPTWSAAAGTYVMAKPALAAPKPDEQPM